MSDSAKTTTAPPQRPAWLDFEQEKATDVAGAGGGAGGGAATSPTFKSDPRGDVPTDRSKAVSLAMEADELQIEGQQFALISFVSPNGTYQHADQMLLKIRGVFPSVETARERAKVLSAFDDKFDLYIIDLYKWVPFPPKVNLKREGDDRITEILNNFFDRDEQSKSDLESRISATRREGKQAQLEGQPEAAEEPLGL